MAIPKKGTRIIKVDNESYRWLIRKKATYGQWAYGSGQIRLAVEHIEYCGSVLVVYTDRKHPKDWATTGVVPVTPSDVANWIRQSIKMGWNPKINGKQYLIKIEDGRVRSLISEGKNTL
ncbi:hypothetical protein [Tunicatimonas pelagia]|uniref:hypothetical protein n=1 Tax=Tunicatimonas pelagia TaxID=931531 RepID=UPI002666F049|nr:hypothetical protein [Tunicatimonas pelagia]WKN41030.1 hypothetical protein P0M28_18510 [Tunicatimonas pelagia]